MAEWFEARVFAAAIEALLHQRQRFALQAQSDSRDADATQQFLRIRLAGLALCIIHPPEMAAARSFDRGRLMAANETVDIAAAVNQVTATDIKRFRANAPRANSIRQRKSQQLFEVCEHALARASR